MLVTLQEIIGMAEKGNYCIPAFNVYNTETVMGVFDAAEEAGKTELQKAQGCRDFRASSAPFLFSEK